MMYAKIVFRNAKRSIKDYLIYIVTMTICVTLFYAFLSISSSYYKPDIDSAYDVTMLSDGMKLAICTVALLLLFLIRYVNNFMLRRRQKEFAIQSVMGIEQKTIGWLFFAETFLMGILSIVIGIALGVFGSQFITAMLLTSYGQEYKLTWTLFPDTVLWTVGFFAICLLVVGLFNLRTIRKIKIINMLYADRQNEPELKKSRFMQIITILYLLFLVVAVIVGIRIKYFYFDSRFDFPLHLMFGGNIVAPAIGLIWLILWFFKRQRRFYHLVIGEFVISIINVIAAASVPRMRSEYMLSFDSGVMNQYLLFLLINIMYLVCCMIFLANTVMIAWKEHSPDNRYQGQRLFLFGQITSKLVTSTKTMILITLTLGVSIVLFVITPVLIEWASGYLDIRSMYDVQICSQYNKVYEEENLPTSDYELVTNYLTKQGIVASGDCTFNLYLPKREDFHNRMKYDFPVLAISLNDYNEIREMLGYETITLSENEFTTQWQTIATEDDMYAFLESHSELETDEGKLTLSTQASNYREAMGETIYNTYTDVLYVFPDRICQELMPVIRNRYIKTEEKLSFQEAKTLNTLFTDAYPELNEKTGAIYYIRMNTLQVNESKASSFILQGTMIYGAVILMVICLTILSLQQLLDAGQYRYRFSVIRKLGVAEQDIKMLVIKQLSVWFGLPVVIAIVISGIAVLYILQMNVDALSAYIGIGAVLSQVAVTVSILILLLMCYFISTWIMFRKSIKE